MWEDGVLISYLYIKYCESASIFKCLRMPHIFHKSLSSNKKRLSDCSKKNNVLIYDSLIKVPTTEINVFVSHASL